MRINPRIILIAASLALYLLPVLIFEYEAEFSWYMALCFVAASIGAWASTPPVRPKRPIYIASTVRLWAALFALAYITGKLGASLLSRDLSADHVTASIEAQGTGAVAGTLMGFLNLACLAILAAGKRHRLFVVAVLLNLLDGILFGAYRSPIIFLALASIFHFRTYLTVAQGLFLSSVGLVALTALNFKRQGLDVQTLVDLGTFARGVFVANNFYDLWTSGISFDVPEMVSRLPLVFVPSAIYPGKGIISFSHLMTEAVYGYVPTIDLKPIITFGIFAESWIYLGTFGFLLVGLCTYMYGRLIADCARVSRFLAIYFSLKYVMIFRSSLDAFIFNYASTYVLLLTLLVGIKCLNWLAAMRASDRQLKPAVAI